ncbi:hypothetical protein [Vibrio phage LV6]|nr:hypothetical protein [Vibrio phage LV6]
MNPLLQKYFEAGLLKEENNHHRRLAEEIQLVARNAGVLPEYIYSKSLLSVLAPNSPLVETMRIFPKVRAKRHGMVLPDHDHLDEVLPTLVGVFSRNRYYARLLTINEALTELESTRALVGTVIVIADCENIEMYGTGTKSSYTKSTLDELISYCYLNDRFLIFTEAGGVDLLSCLNGGSIKRVKASYLNLNNL